ncbi:MAG: hypothetical protein OR994_07645, partial [Candidatus Poseidoniales archaeon]|nr:hypothetical protein [Candidatus Poseidoniales archaeon]
IEQSGTHKPSAQVNKFCNEFSNAILLIRLMTITHSAHSQSCKEPNIKLQRNHSYSMCIDLESLINSFEYHKSNSNYLFDSCKFILNYERIVLLNSNGSYLESLSLIDSLGQEARWLGGGRSLWNLHFSDFGLFHPCLVNCYKFAQLITEWTKSMAGMKLDEKNLQELLKNEMIVSSAKNIKTRKQEEEEEDPFLVELIERHSDFQQMLASSESENDAAISKEKWENLANSIIQYSSLVIMRRAAFYPARDLLKSYERFSKDYPTIFPLEVKVEIENLMPLIPSKNTPGLKEVTGTQSLSELRNFHMKQTFSNDTKIDVSSIQEAFSDSISVIGDLTINNPLAPYDPDPKRIKEAIPNVLGSSTNLLSLAEFDSSIWQRLTEKTAGRINKLISYNDMLFFNIFKVTKGERMRQIRYGPYDSKTGDLSWITHQGEFPIDPESDEAFLYQQFLSQSYRVSKKTRTTKTDRINLMSRMLESISAELLRYVHPHKKSQMEEEWKEWYTHRPILLPHGVKEMPIALHVHCALKRLYFLHNRLEICKDLTYQVHMMEYYRKPIRQLLDNIEQQIGLELCHLQLISHQQDFINSIKESNIVIKLMFSQYKESRNLRNESAHRKGGKPQNIWRYQEMRYVSKDYPFISAEHNPIGSAINDYKIFNSSEDVFVMSERHRLTPSHLLSKIPNKLWEMGTEIIDPMTIYPHSIAEMMDKIFQQPEEVHQWIDYVSNQSLKGVSSPSDSDVEMDNEQ